MKIMKLNEWKCDISIDDASVYVEPTGALKNMVEYFKLKYNPRTVSYDCDGNVDLREYYNDLSVNEQSEFDNAFVRNGKMTITFGHIKGKFALPGDDGTPYILTSLEGCPKIVGGWFDCSFNILTSLKGCPQTVGGDFYCNNNQLTSLEGCPQNVGGRFNCSFNILTSLKGCPKIVDGDFDCRHNQLTSLEGCPKTVGDFWCNYNQLTSLKGCPESVGGDFFCSNNQLTSLKGCPKSVGGYFSCRNNKAQFTENDVKAVCDVKNEIYV